MNNAMCKGPSFINTNEEKQAWSNNGRNIYHFLLHIMCGYQCDKAVNKNDTREVI